MHSEIKREMTAKVMKNLQKITRKVLKLKTKMRKKVEVRQVLLQNKMRTGLLLSKIRKN